MRDIHEFMGTVEQWILLRDYFGESREIFIVNSTVFEYYLQGDIGYYLGKTGGTLGALAW